MNILIKTIPHNEQRYRTIGDYWTDAEEVLQVRISKMPDWRYEVLILVHELVEWFICCQQGIKEEEIKAFDEKYEEDRLDGLHGPEDEPGFDSSSPYKFAHTFATAMEMALSTMLLVNWSDYEKEASKVHNSDRN